MPHPRARTLAFALVLAAPLSVAACRSRRLAQTEAPPPAPPPAVSPETQRFSDLVDALTRIGSHGAVDPAKERDAGR